MRFYDFLKKLGHHDPRNMSAKKRFRIFSEDYLARFEGFLDSLEIDSESNEAKTLPEEFKYKFEKKISNLTGLSTSEISIPLEFRTYYDSLSTIDPKKTKKNKTFEKVVDAFFMDFLNLLSRYQNPGSIGEVKRFHNELSSSLICLLAAVANESRKSIDSEDYITALSFLLPFLYGLMPINDTDFLEYQCLGDHCKLHILPPGQEEPLLIQDFMNRITEMRSFYVSSELQFSLCYGFSFQEKIVDLYCKGLDTAWLYFKEKSGFPVLHCEKSFEGNISHLFYRLLLGLELLLPKSFKNIERCGNPSCENLILKKKNKNTCSPGCQKQLKRKKESVLPQVENSFEFCPDITQTDFLLIFAP